MKKFISYLTRLCSPRMGAQKDDGSTRLRVDYDSIYSRSACAPRTPSLFEAKSRLASPHLRVLPLKLVSVLAILLTIGVGNSWGYSATFVRISSVSELSANDSVLVVIQDAKKKTSGYAVQNNSTNYSAVTITTTTDTITCTNQKCVWKVAKSNSNWQFVRGTQYIAWTSSTTLSANATGNTNTWTISDLSGYSGYMRIKNTGTGTRDIGWSDSKFAAYANSNYVNQMATSPAVALKQYDGAVSIYKKQIGTSVSLSKAASSNGSLIWTYLFARFFRHCAQYINHLPSCEKTTKCSFSAHLSTTDFQQVTNL